MTLDPQPPLSGPEPLPASALPVEPSLAYPLPTEPPPFVPMPPPLPEFVPPAPRKPWGFWATLGWTALCIVAMFVAQTAVAVVLILQGEVSGNHIDPLTLNHNGLLISTAPVASLILCAPLLVLFVKIRRLPLLPYLAIARLRLKPMLVSLGVFIAGMFLLGLIFEGLHVKETNEVMDMASSAPSTALLLFSAVICAPVFEELLFRGFMFRGLALKAGPIVAILLTSLVWASLHIGEYSVWPVVAIFWMGLILGGVRWITKSTTITILLHSAQNLFAMLMALHSIRGQS